LGGEVEAVEDAVAAVAAVVEVVVAVAAAVAVAGPVVAVCAIRVVGGLKAAREPVPPASAGPRESVGPAEE
jgi:hypothetical protein